MFDPKPKLHEGSRTESFHCHESVVDHDGTRSLVAGNCLVLGYDETELGSAYEEDALAVLRPVDPVWQAALEVVRTGDAWASKQDLDASLAHCKALDALRDAMTGEKEGAEDV